MEMLYLLLLLLLFSLFVSALLKFISTLYFPSKKPTHRLPPGPPTFPIIGTLLRLHSSFFNVEQILRSLHAKFGPVVTIRMGAHRPIFISVADRILAHQALVQQGARCADRPAASAAARVFNSNQCNISSSFYGPTWRLLRRNLTTGILHPSRVKTYGHGRKWVLQVLKNRFECQAQCSSCGVVSVMENLQYAMFSLLLFMCFGDKLDEEKINKVAEVQRRMLLNAFKFNVLDFWPSLTKILLWKSWRTLHQCRQDRDDALVPLIRARMKLLSSKDEDDSNTIVSYMDTLLSLQLPDEKRKLNEEEIVILCSEFLNAGTDTTSTALQWIMANLVKYPQIQEKLFFEIKGFMRNHEEEVKTEDLPKMRYLKAVILEGLRRHPPAHFVLPHAVTEEVALDKYVVTKDGIISFAVADIGWDPKVWDDPMAFTPERFLIGGGDDHDHDHEEAFDITGSKEIKMMPFGVGRRMCPAYGLAMLHLEYFVANFIWNYEWKPVGGEDIDLTEKEEFTVVMKTPLRAQICRRWQK